MRCGKAEEKENGQQIGVIEKGRGYILGAPTRDCLVQFSSVQRLFQQAPSPGFSRWSALLWTAECGCVGWTEAWCRAVRVLVGGGGAGGVGGLWCRCRIGEEVGGVPLRSGGLSFVLFFGGSSWNLSRPPSPAEALQLLPLLCTWRSCYVFPLRAKRDTTRRQRERKRWECQSAGRETV